MTLGEAKADTRAVLHRLDHRGRFDRPAKGYRMEQLQQIEQARQAVAAEQAKRDAAEGRTRHVVDLGVAPRPRPHPQGVVPPRLTRKPRRAQMNKGVRLGKAGKAAGRKAATGG